MGSKSNISWTDASWNPVVGCSEVSSGCENCYAVGQAARIQAMDAGRGVPSVYDGTTTEDKQNWTGLVKCLPERLDIPVRWTKPRRIFVNSMSDLFHPDVPDEFILNVFMTMMFTERHTFQVLTKRPQRMAELLNTPKFKDELIGMPEGLENEAWPWPLPNVWLGVSIEEDKHAYRADYLRDTPAAVRWISAEPLLGPLPSLDLTDVDWLVAGGESGKNARPMQTDWLRHLRDKCGPPDELWHGCIGCGDDVGTDSNCADPGDPDWGECTCDGCDAVTIARSTAFHFKQWGEWSTRDQVNTAGMPPGSVPQVGETYRFGKRRTGRLLDGVLWDEYPTGDLQQPISNRTIGPGKAPG